MKQLAGEESTRLTNDQLSEVMNIIRDVDSVELKLTVPVAEHRATVVGLPFDPVEAEPRQVYFFDTPDLALNRAGVVVRARRVRGGGADTVVKLRPVVPAELPADLRHSGSFNVEIDFLPGGFVCSGSLKGKALGDQVREVAAGELPLRKLLSKEQRAFYKKHAPADLDLDALATLGPTFALKAMFWPKKLNRKLVAEFWLYPDGSRLLELSTKCLPTEAFQVAAQLRAYLGKRGVTISSIQQTKTKTALEYYADELRSEGGKATVEALPKPGPIREAV
jgi:hypothetical protein